MKGIFKFSILFLTILFVACNNKQPETAKEQKTEPVFPKGDDNYQQQLYRYSMASNACKQ